VKIQKFGGRGMKRLFLIVLSAILVFLLNSCTSFSPYRTSESDCGAPISITSDNIEKNDKRPNPFDCSIQTHITTTPYVEPENSAGLPFEPDRYQLAFLEYGRGVSQDVHREQMRKIQKRLNSTPQDYVIVFVHGWRHNAMVGDSDVQRFRALLAYARSFLNTRCTEMGRYCHAGLTGIYVGWRGASVIEPDNLAVGTAMAVPTFWARKAESERVGKALIPDLHELENDLRLTSGDYSADKMLVMGHSFGGNALASAIGDEVARAVQNHPMGAEMPPPLGDLIVLVNPASEANNWTKVQKQLATKVGRSIVVGKNPPIDQFENIFPVTQRPTYLAFTSACNWAKDEIQGELSQQQKEKQPKARGVDCDSATARAFPLGQFGALRWSTDRLRTIGHLDPVYDKILDGTPNPKDSKKFKFIPRPGTERLGTSHEFIVNNRLFVDGKPIPTNFANASSPEYSQCDVADGWLLKAKNRTLLSSGRGWDTRYNKEGKVDHVLWVDKKHAVEAQFRHSLSLPGSFPGQVPSVAPANSPFWNIRAFDSAIAFHGKYVGYPFWCSVNQLVLDDPVAK
jgi:hypothetical protein